LRRRFSFTYVWIMLARLYDTRWPWKNRRSVAFSSEFLDARFLARVSALVTLPTHDENSTKPEKSSTMF